jgi:hypothetical protein
MRREPLPGCITLASGCPDLARPPTRCQPRSPCRRSPHCPPRWSRRHRSATATLSRAPGRMRPGWRTATRRASETVWRCPGSAIGARPEHGYVNIPSLFWIVPGTYAGQHLVADDTLAVPWTLSWDEDLTTTTTAPCPDDPDQMCTSSETHTRHREQSYTDATRSRSRPSPRATCGTSATAGDRAGVRPGCGTGDPLHRVGTTAVPHPQGPLRSGLGRGLPLADGAARTNRKARVRRPAATLSGPVCQWPVRTLQRHVQLWRAKTILAFDDQWTEMEGIVQQSLPRPLRVAVEPGLAVECSV